MDYRILITDITVYGDLRCVAGWEVDRKQMIRPEPSRAAFWPSNQTGPKKAFHPGNIVKLSAASPIPPTEYPHMTEDKVVEGTPKLEAALKPSQFSSELAKIGDPLKTVFGKNVQFVNNKAFIATGTKCRSLYGTDVTPAKLKFYEDTYDPKKPRLRCSLAAEGIVADLSVSAVDIRELWSNSGIQAVRQFVTNAKRIHLRIGLARGFGQFQDRCYLQINGIYPI